MKLTIAAIALAIAGSAIAQDGPPAGNAERGREIYHKLTCYSCHGTLGQGGERGAGPKLVPNPFPYAGFIRQLRNPRQDMPRYGDKWVSDQAVADIYAYLLSIKPAPEAKDIPLLQNM